MLTRRIFFVQPSGNMARGGNAGTDGEACGDGPAFINCRR